MENTRADSSGLSVVQSGDAWCVCRGSETIAEGLSNAQAWRMLDRLSGDPLNRSEEVHDWSFRKLAASHTGPSGLRQEGIEKRLALAEDAVVRPYVANAPRGETPLRR